MNEYQSAAFIELGNLETGAFDSTIALHSHVFVTNGANVCPRCVAGRCDSGARQGAACSVDGTVFVSAAQAADKMFALSKDCPPLSDTLAGTLEITLPLTTGASTLTQPGASLRRCVRQPGRADRRGATPDSCQGGAR